MCRTRVVARFQTVLIPFMSDGCWPLGWTERREAGVGVVDWGTRRRGGGGSGVWAGVLISISVRRGPDTLEVEDPVRECVLKEVGGGGGGKDFSNLEEEEED